MISASIFTASAVSAMEEEEVSKTLRSLRLESPEKQKESPPKTLQRRPSPKDSPKGEKLPERKSSQEKQILKSGSQSSSPAEEQKELITDQNSPQRERVASISIYPLRKQKDSIESSQHQETLLRQTSRPQIILFDERRKSEEKPISPTRHRRKSSSSSQERQILKSGSQSSSPIEEQKTPIMERNSHTRERAVTVSISPLREQKDATESPERQAPLFPKLDEKSSRGVKIWGHSDDCKERSKNSFIYFKYFLYNSLITEDFNISITVDPLETFVYNHSLRVGPNKNPEAYENANMLLDKYIIICKEYDDLFCSERNEHTTRHFFKR